MQPVFYFVIAALALFLGYALSGPARRKRPWIAGLFMAISLALAGVFAWWAITAL